MDNAKKIEQMKEHIDRLHSLCLAMELPFMSFIGDVNRAVGVAVVSEYFSPTVYMNAAEDSLAKIESAIKNYRQNQLQNYESEPKSNEDIATEFSETLVGLGVK